ncbi:nicotinamide mononucleotide transporter [Pseudomaricurvus sp. HS19]|uniref:nicotinamide mononucleotide transporter n=1 Tax=Pseudomaricurvus sp. HS19 TaxID=2692626 RepID=UPI0013714746|nr:nicotinamide mononucleotide transporter [Pseudomaricurvus sp. HS19]MYM62414.1 hypothetical protein [Pseudomaricurvus sp. HS19]
MDLFLQVWGGSCYLSNKILFATAESFAEARKRQLKILGWIVYLLGVPAWVVILVAHNDWIAASIEAGGIPAMLLGLYNTIHNHQRVNRRFNKLVSLCTYSALAFGFSISIYHHGGLASVSQILEVGVMFGFLLGSYFLAKGNNNGWLMFMLMNVSMAGLMYIQEKPILMAQQLLSLCFVLFGFIKAHRNHKAALLQK